MVVLISNPLKLIRVRLKRVSFLVCLLLIAVNHLSAQQKVQADAEVLGTDPPFSFPEKVVVGPNHSVYFLDTTLSGIFVQDLRNGMIRRLCEALRSASDIASDAKGQIWVLSNNGSKISRLTPQCSVQTEIRPAQLALRIATNAFGEVIALSETGSSLFTVFSSQGKQLRSFGERIKYQDEVATNELSDGHIVPDNTGGFYFSFNYPPLVRHYGRTGQLLDEFKPESDIRIEPPNITVRTLGNAVSVNSRYQILVLDLAADAHGRLYFLISGKNKVPALNNGTPKLVVTTNKGRTLKTLTLAHDFHRIVVGNGNLYLFRNRPPFRLDRYVVF